MVKLRLQRFGAKKRPYYRVVAADSRNRRDGRFIEQVGYYDAASYGNLNGFKEDRIRYWLEKGAQPTDTVRGLLKKAGITIDG